MTPLLAGCAGFNVASGVMWSAMICDHQAAPLNAIAAARMSPP
jgi:hypothetical protein